MLFSGAAAITVGSAKPSERGLFYNATATVLTPVHYVTAPIFGLLQLATFGVYASKVAHAHVNPLATGGILSARQIEAITAQVTARAASGRLIWTEDSQRNFAANLQTLTMRALETAADRLDRARDANRTAIDRAASAPLPADPIVRETTPSGSGASNGSSAGSERDLGGKAEASPQGSGAAASSAASAASGAADEAVEIPQMYQVEIREDDPECNVEGLQGLKKDALRDLKRLAASSDEGKGTDSDAFRRLTVEIARLNCQIAVYEKKDPAKMRRLEKACHEAERTCAVATYGELEGLKVQMKEADAEALYLKQTGEFADAYEAKRTHFNLQRKATRFEFVDDARGRKRELKTIDLREATELAELWEEDGDLSTKLQMLELKKEASIALAEFDAEEIQDDNRYHNAVLDAAIAAQREIVDHFARDEVNEPRAKIAAEMELFDY